MKLVKAEPNANITPGTSIRAPVHNRNNTVHNNPVDSCPGCWDYLGYTTVFRKKTKQENRIIFCYHIVVVSDRQ